MADLPAFKARPEWIGPVLALIKENEGNYSSLQHEVAAWWRAQSGRSKPPSIRNSLRAVFGPTLRHLRLIRGDGERMTVTHLGTRLLAARGEGEPAFKKEFAAQLVRLDAESWVKVLPYVEGRGRRVPAEQILEYFQTSYPEIHVDRQKVNKYLNYFAYVGLIDISDTHVDLRIRQYQAAKTGAWAPRPSDSEFAQAVEDTYDHLSRGRAYVPIPLVRDAVCRQFGIWDEEFDEMLANIPKETDRRIIQLTAPMARAAGGLHIGDTYVYYVAVHRKAKTG